MNKIKETLAFSRINLITVFTSVSLSILMLLTWISFGDYGGNYFQSPAYAAKEQSNSEGPIIDDPNLVVQPVYQGLKSPTAMAFIAPNDILVLEKDEGTCTENCKR